MFHRDKHSIENVSWLLLPPPPPPKKTKQNKNNHLRHLRFVPYSKWQSHTHGSLIVMIWCENKLTNHSVQNTVWVDTRTETKCGLVYDAFTKHTNFFPFFFFSNATWFHESSETRIHLWWKASLASQKTSLVVGGKHKHDERWINTRVTCVVYSYERDTASKKQHWNCQIMRWIQIKPKNKTKKTNPAHTINSRGNWCTEMPVKKTTPIKTESGVLD